MCQLTGHMPTGPHAVSKHAMMPQVETQELTDVWRELDNRGPQIQKSLTGDLLVSRAQGVTVQSSFQSVADMDSPSKFFFNLEEKKVDRADLSTLCIQIQDGC